MQNEDTSERDEKPADPFGWCDRLFDDGARPGSGKECGRALGRFSRHFPSLLGQKGSCLLAQNEGLHAVQLQS